MEKHAFSDMAQILVNDPVIGGGGNIYIYIYIYMNSNYILH
jgi:hypothetical protein